MRTHRTRLAVALLLCMLGSCGHVLIPGGSRPYEALLVPTGASRDEAFAAAVRAATAVEGATTRVAPGRYSVTIVLAQDDSMRDWSQITVLGDGTVRVVVRTELLDGRRWRHAPSVCDGYDYSRERRLADEVLRAMGAAHAAAAGIAPGA